MHANEINGVLGSRGDPLRASGRILKIVSEMGSSAVGSIGPGIGVDAARSFVESTKNEKKELQALNDRLCNYIERVRKLEEENRRLCQEINDAKESWGKETAEFKNVHCTNLRDSRREMNDEAKRKGELELRLNRENENVSEMRLRYDTVKSAVDGDIEKKGSWERALHDAEREAELVKSRLARLAQSERKLNEDGARLRDELQTAHRNLDEEATHRVDLESQVQTLMEELNFLKRVNEVEVKELKALLDRAPADTREFFKNELAQAILDITDEYDYIAALGNKEMEGWYKLKVTEAEGSANRPNLESSFERDEMKRMRDILADVGEQLTDAQRKNAALESQLRELSGQMDETRREYEKALSERDANLRRMREEGNLLIQELQALLDTKQLLDSEIAIYRTMLQNEESRSGLRQVVEQAMKTRSLQQQEDKDSTRNVRGEVATKITFQKESKGNVFISNCDLDGRFVELHNAHVSRSEDISGYKIRRTADNGKEVVYTIPPNTILAPESSVKIFARGRGAKEPNSLILQEETSWGRGKNVVTSLLNRELEEKAAHRQFTVQVSQ